MSPVALAWQGRWEGEHLVEGALRCTDTSCNHEYPVVDGIPLLLHDLPRFLSADPSALLDRDDLDPQLQGIVGDCLGPGTTFDLGRQHLSNYAEDHWGELASVDPGAESGAVALAEGGLDDLAPLPGGLALDLGCATGRVTHALTAHTDGLVLGIDTHLRMLRVAARALRTGVVRWSRRRTGLVYEPRSADLPARGAARVDFWLADATALPLPDGVAGMATSLNLLDCVHTPTAHIAELGRVLAPGGAAVLTTPYDWSPSATPLAHWVGGHSQRAADGGLPEARLRGLFAEGGPGGALHIVADEPRVPWSVRLHDRCRVMYDAHRLGLRRI